MWRVPIDDYVDEAEDEIILEPNEIALPEGDEDLDDVEEEEDEENA